MSMSIIHSGIKFVPKYYKKVFLGGDKVRYFYSKEAYDAYLEEGTITRLANKQRNAAKTQTQNTQTSTTNQQQIERSGGSRSGTGNRAQSDQTSTTTGRSTETRSQSTTNNSKEETSGNWWSKVVDKVTPWDTDREKAAKKAEAETKAYAEAMEANRQELVDAGFKLKSDNGSDDADMAAINPKYGTAGYNNNCALCTLAYELRQRGFDVEAGSTNTGFKSNERAAWYGMTAYEWSKERTDVKDLIPFSDEELDAIKNDLVDPITKDNEDRVASAIEKDIIERYSEGARGEFAVEWRNLDYGHSMVWEVENGKVVIRDCQSNETYTVRDIIQRASTANYIRTDDKKIDPSILNKYVKNKR